MKIELDSQKGIDLSDIIFAIDIFNSQWNNVRKISSYTITDTTIIKNDKL